MTGFGRSYAGVRDLWRRWAGNTVSGRPGWEVVSALVVAPVVEEAIFRVALARLAEVALVPRGTATLASAVVFGLAHWRFGRLFMGYAFIGGLVLGATYDRAGYRGAVLLHAVANLIDLSVGWRRYLHDRR